MSTKSEYELPGHFDTQSHGAFLAFLQQNLGQSLRVSARQINKIDINLLQFLLCISHAWRANGATIRICQMSQETAARLATLGIGQDLLLQGETRDVA